MCFTNKKRAFSAQKKFNKSSTTMQNSTKIQQKLQNDISKKMA